MEYILGPVLVLLSDIAEFIFYSPFFKSKPQIKKLFLLYLSLNVFINLITTSMNTQTQDFFNYFSLALGALFICISFYGSNLHKLVICSIFNVIALVLEYLLLYVLSLWGITIEIIRNSYILFTVASVTSKTSLLIFAIFVRTFLKDRKRKDVSSLKAIQMIIYPMTCYIFLYTYCNYIVETGKTGVIIIYPFLMLGSTVALLSIISKLDEETETKQQNALLEQQLKLGMENIDSLNSAYSQQRRLTHDFNNHLSVIYSLLNSGDVAKATDYTNQLLNTSISVSRLFDSGNSIVDTLLTQKYNHAKEQGIRMQVLVEDLSVVAMSADKLVVVLSNLLDNAIEAASFTEDKLIKIKFTQENGGHILTVQNTALNGPSMENHQIVSTKKDKFSHGYGMKNIYSVLDSYGYPYTSAFDSGMYTFTAMMID